MSVHYWKIISTTVRTDKGANALRKGALKKREMWADKMRKTLVIRSDNIKVNTGTHIHGAGKNGLPQVYLQ